MIDSNDSLSFSTLASRLECINTEAGASVIIVITDDYLAWIALRVQTSKL